MPVIRTIEKLWGREIWHHNDARYAMKTLELNAGAQSSLHYHREKDETFLVTYGEVAIQVGTDAAACEWRILHAGESVDLAAGIIHRFKALTTRAMVIEASTTHDDADVVRIEESRTTL